MLSRSQPTPGAVIGNHQEILPLLKGLFDTTRTTPPINLVHVDAHADMGISTTSHMHVLPVTISMKVELRIDDALRHANSGNWLLYAIACRWIASVVYVLHPGWYPTRPDLLRMYFKHRSLDSEVVQLLPCSAEELGRTHGADLHSEADLGRPRTEPEVRFAVRALTELELVSAPDYVVLAKSPAYTPPTTDRLIHVVQEYMTDLPHLGNR